MPVGPAGWDREYLDPDRDPEDPYDKGAPDYQSGEKKDLKWRVVCAGVESLIKAKGLKEQDVMLWLDWQSIYQARARLSFVARTPPHLTQTGSVTPTALRVLP